MGTMLEFITRMGYHFRWKIGRKLAELGRIRKHVGGKMAENELKIGEILPKSPFCLAWLAVLQCSSKRRFQTNLNEKIG